MWEKYGGWGKLPPNSVEGYKAGVPNTSIAKVLWVDRMALQFFLDCPSSIAL